VKQLGGVVRRGTDFDDWDLEIRSGLLGSARLQMVAEEHGQGKQLVRWRVSPKCSEIGLIVLSTLIAISVGAGTTRAWTRVRHRDDDGPAAWSLCPAGVRGRHGIGSPCNSRKAS